MRERAWRSSSPTRNWRWLGSRFFWCLRMKLASPPPSPHREEGGVRGTKEGARLQRARDFLHLEALDRVADLNVLVILEGHAAFEAFAHLAHFVLEALQ